MASKFDIGHNIVIKPVSDQGLSLRDSGIEPYAGQTGEITDLYWLSPNSRQAFYVYTVRIGIGSETVVLHEDELEARPR